MVTEAEPDNAAFQPTAPASKQQETRSNPARPQSNRGQAPYISTYRRILESPNTLPSKMLQYIANAEVVTYGDLKKAWVREFGCKSEESGSIGASLNVLKLDGYVTIEGRGHEKRIRALQKAH